ncbi:MAG: histidine kinase dimerization/phospho-acceptor domain-containing protein, partial [Myxococcota bacterium]|nr:histidine kinase dimerization/phospho-acceptor domain-containing protein [Myxococcota bacterium]
NLGRVLTASLIVSAAHLHALGWRHGLGPPIAPLQLVGMGMATAFLPVVFVRRTLLWTYLGSVLGLGCVALYLPSGDRDASLLVGAELLVAGLMLLLRATHAWSVDRLRRTEARHALAAAGTADGLWEWDLVQKRLEVTAQWKGVLGFGPDALPGDAPDLWLDRVHPDDKSGLLAALDAHIAGRTRKFEHEHRLMAKGGVWRWVLVRGQAERREGRTTWMAGWMMDLTGRREGPAAEERSRLLERTTRASAVGMAVLQADGGFSWISGTLEDLLAAWPDAATWWRAVATHRPVPEGWRPETVLTFTPDFNDPTGARRVFEIRMTTLPRQVAGAALSGRLLVVREVTEQVLAEEELKALSSAHLQARDAALKANRAKDTFVANMSHELRTPLNAIIGYSEMLAEDARKDGDALLEQDLDRIRAAGRQLLDLVNGILDLSRVEAGRLELVPGRVMLRPMLDEVV